MEEVKLMTRLHKTRVIIIKYLFVCFRMVGSCCTENPCGCEGDEGIYYYLSIVCFIYVSIFHPSIIVSYSGCSLSWSVMGYLFIKIALA